MQLYPDKYTNILTVMTHIQRKYGVQGYFKGLAPRMLRRTLMAAMAWTVYEQMMRNLGVK
jgi:solute carrier family 25, member 38